MYGLSRGYAPQARIRYSDGCTRDAIGAIYIIGEHMRAATEICIEKWTNADMHCSVLCLRQCRLFMQRSCIAISHTADMSSFEQTMS